MLEQRQHVSVHVLIVGKMHDEILVQVQTSEYAPLDLKMINFNKFTKILNIPNLIFSAHYIQKLANVDLG